MFVAWKRRTNARRRNWRCVTNIWKNRRTLLCSWNRLRSQRRRVADAADATIMYPIQVAVTDRRARTGHVRNPKKIRLVESAKSDAANGMIMTVTARAEVRKRNEAAKREAKIRRPSVRTNRRVSLLSRRTALCPKQPYRPVNRIAVTTPARREADLVQEDRVAAVVDHARYHAAVAQEVVRAVDRAVDLAAAQEVAADQEAAVGQEVVAADRKVAADHHREVALALVLRAQDEADRRAVAAHHREVVRVHRDRGRAIPEVARKVAVDHPLEVAPGRAPKVQQGHARVIPEAIRLRRAHPAVHLKRHFLFLNFFFLQNQFFQLPILISYFDFDVLSDIINIH